MLVFVKMVNETIGGIQSKTIFDISAVSLQGLISAMSHSLKGVNHEISKSDKYLGIDKH